jgi:hypothetical protein
MSFVRLLFFLQCFSESGSEAMAEFSSALPAALFDELSP